CAGDGNYVNYAMDYW
nr:immunoglobulin heavy chain junction region [Mus musculus]